MDGQASVVHGFLRLTSGRPTHQLELDAGNLLLDTGDAFYPYPLGSAAESSDGLLPFLLHNICFLHHWASHLQQESAWCRALVLAQYLVDLKNPDIMTNDLLAIELDAGLLLTTTTYGLWNAQVTIPLTAHSTA